MNYKAREIWINDAVQLLRPIFEEKKFSIPRKLRVSCGWPSTGGTAKKKRSLGEAWASAASGDEHFEIFISPYLNEPAKVLSTLAHELVHVTVGLKCGHKGAFAICARGIGLEGRMTSTHAGEALAKQLAAIARKLGTYPHASLDGMTTGRKKDTTRMIKAHCTTCTYTIRATMRWLLIAVPNCPNPDCIAQGDPMEIDLPPPEELPDGE
jgi:hypothetical protein